MHTHIFVCVATHVILFSIVIQCCFIKHESPARINAYACRVFSVRVFRYDVYICVFKIDCLHCH